MSLELALCEPSRQSFTLSNLQSEKKHSEKYSAYIFGTMQNIEKLLTTYVQFKKIYLSFDIFNSTFQRC